MSDLLFTSSSEATACDPTVGHAASIAAHIKRWPLGFLGAAVLVTALHLTVSALYPEPLTDDSINNRALEGTRQSPPAIVLAGDSRTQLGVDASRLNERLALPAGWVINLATPLGDSSVFTTTYHKFAPRFASRPIILFGISLFTVNDGAIEMLSQEFLQTLRLRERLQVVRPSEAIACEFLPEKYLWLRTMQPAQNLFPARVARYDPPIPAEWNVGTWTPEETASKLYWVKQYWFGQPNLDGVRWRKFEQDMTSLQAQGAQVVLIDEPFHPIMSRAMTEAPLSEASRRFRTKLDDLCERLQIPLLRYSAADLNADDLDAVFMDLTHLNEAGAALLTDRIAGDVAQLIAARKIHLPQPLAPACQRYDAYASARNPG